MNYAQEYPPLFGEQKIFFLVYQKTGQERKQLNHFLFESDDSESIIISAS
jgi:hypothetical protein